MSLVNWTHDGHLAADMAIRILNGEKPENIPIVTSTNVYMFDQRALKRWGLKESNLPPGSILLNRQPGFWEVYKKYAIAAVLGVHGAGFGDCRATVAPGKEKKERTGSHPASGVREADRRSFNDIQQPS